MHFLLVNQDPAVSRLITLSVEKLGFEIYETVSFEELPLESYDIVFVDNEQYDEFTIDDQKKSGLTQYFVYISSKGESKPKNMNSILEKPFLPTDFIDLILQIGVKNSNEIPEIDDEVKTNLDDNVVVYYSINLEDEETAIDLDLDDIELGSVDAVEDYETDLNVSEEKTDDSDMNLTDVLEGKDLEINEDKLDSILDSEDIDEVKQLLEDDNENDLELDESEEDSDENKESVIDDKIQLDNRLKGELELSEKSIEEMDAKEKIISDDSDISELEAQMESIEIEDDLKLHEDSDENKEEIEDLDEDLEDTSVEDLETTLDTLIEESETIDSTVSSIAEINEGDILRALGNGESTYDNTTQKEIKPEEETNIKEEVEARISKSVKKALSASSIKDVLKGMRVNLSITFEEDN